MHVLNQRGLSPTLHRTVHEMIQVAGTRHPEDPQRRPVRRGHNKLGHHPFECSSSFVRTRRWIFRLMRNEKGSSPESKRTRICYSIVAVIC